MTAFLSKYDINRYVVCGIVLQARTRGSSRALKCGLADWYMKQGGDENRKRALKLLVESAKEGFGFARQKLAAL